MHRILLFEPDPSIREAIRQTLIHAGHNVAVVDTPAGVIGAKTPPGATLFILGGAFDQPSSGGSQALTTAVVALRAPKILLPTTEVGPHVDRTAMNVVGELKRPFKQDDLMAMVSHVPLPGEAHAKRDGKGLSQVGIDEFLAGRQFEGPVYIRIGAEKFICISETSADLDPNKLRIYKTRGVRYLYIDRDDFLKYMDKLKFLSLKTLAKGGGEVDPKQRQDLTIAAARAGYDALTGQVMDVKLFEGANSMMESVVEVFSNYPATFDLLTSLKGLSDRMFAHSMAVSLLSVQMASKMSWSSSATTYKIGMAALLHDIGLKEIDPAVMSKKKFELTPEEEKIMEEHPNKAVEILKTMGCFTDDVVQAVAHHHENCLGTGYPGKLTRSRIQPLARVIAVADAYSKIFMDAKPEDQMNPKKAVEQLLLTAVDDFDKDNLTALIEIVGLKPEELDARAQMIFLTKMAA